MAPVVRPQDSLGLKDRCLGAMAARGLPLYVATLLTGLLECVGFAGVLFGWTSLVFVFKTEHYFENLCEPQAGPLGNDTGVDEGEDFSRAAEFWLHLFASTPCLPLS